MLQISSCPWCSGSYPWAVSRRRIWLFKKIVTDGVVLPHDSLAALALAIDVFVYLLGLSKIILCGLFQVPTLASLQ